MFWQKKNSLEFFSILNRIFSLCIVFQIVKMGENRKDIKLGKGEKPQMANIIKINCK